MDKKIKFKDGNIIPKIGLGTWEAEGEAAVQAVRTALEAGYRHIDTADVYGNHRQVAQGIKDSQVPRDDIFVTTKIWRSDLGKDDVQPAVERFLQELELDYIDLLLIHWPNESIPVQESLQAMQQVKKQGKINNIGISNFYQQHLEAVIESGVEVVNNQFEFHPSLNQQDLVETCQENDITVTAYSPIARGDDLNMNVITDIAEKRDVSPAQICLNWIMSKDLIAIPKSTDPEHIKDNLAALEWELTDEEIGRIDEASNKENRTVKPGFASFD